MSHVFGRAGIFRDAEFRSVLRIGAASISERAMRQV